LAPFTTETRTSTLLVSSAGTFARSVVARGATFAAKSRNCWAVGRGASKSIPGKSMPLIVISAVQAACTSRPVAVAAAVAG